VAVADENVVGKRRSNVSHHILPLRGDAWLSRRLTK